MLFNFFWCVAFASPHESNPNLDEKTVATKPQSESTEKLNDVSVTPAPEGSAAQKTYVEDREYFYPYSSSMGPRLGLFFDNFDRISEGEYPTSLIGFFYMAPSITDTHYEFGLDLQSNARGALNGYLKKFFNPSNKFRVFGKAGLSIPLLPERGVANLVAIRDFRLRGGIGLEDLLKDPASLRWDLELTYGLSEFVVAVVFGYSWGW